MLSNIEAESINHHLSCIDTKIDALVSYSELTATILSRIATMMESKRPTEESEGDETAAHLKALDDEVYEMCKRITDISQAVNQQLTNFSERVDDLENEYAPVVYADSLEKRIHFLEHEFADEVSRRFTQIEDAHNKLVQDTADHLTALENECALVEYVDSINERVTKMRNMCNNRINALDNEVGAISKLVTTKCDSLNAQLQDLYARTDERE